MFKKCKICSEEKHVDGFYKRNSKFSGSKLGDYEANCKECRVTHYYEYEYWRKVKNRYGLTRERHTQFLEEQGHKCPICLRDLSDISKVVIDHCHKTGVVRGILCVTCNTGLGSFHDKTENLLNAVKYLEKYKCR